MWIMGSFSHNLALLSNVIEPPVPPSIQKNETFLNLLLLSEIISMWIPCLTKRISIFSMNTTSEVLSIFQINYNSVMEINNPIDQ